MRTLKVGAARVVLVMAICAGLMPGGARASTAHREHRSRPGRTYVSPGAVKYTSQHFDLSTEAATEHMEVQARGSKIVQDMHHALGRTYGGVWFNPGSGRYTVGIAKGGQHSKALPYLESSGVAADTSFVSVNSSYEELEQAQKELGKKFAPLMAQGNAATGIDVKDNALTIRLSTKASAAQVASAEAAAAQGSVKIDVVAEPPQNVELTPAGCENHGSSPQLLFCDKSLRGGVSIVDSNGSNSRACSLGFMFRNSTGEYVMTAGHCFLEQGSAPWYSAYRSFTEWEYIGNYVGHYVGENGDFGFIQVSPLSPWLPILDPSSVASLDPTGPWGENESQFLENITWSAEGDINCRTGGSSDTQCGEVLQLNESVPISGLGVVGKLTRDTFCAIPGDSGGTVWGNHSGMGMTEAINAECGHPGAETWYTEAIWDMHYIVGEFYVPPYGEL